MRSGRTFLESISPRMSGKGSLDLAASNYFIKNFVLGSKAERCKTGKGVDVQG